MHKPCNETIRRDYKRVRKFIKNYCNCKKVMLHYRNDIERMIRMYATMEEYQDLEKALNKVKKIVAEKDETIEALEKTIATLRKTNEELQKDLSKMTDKYFESQECLHAAYRHQQEIIEGL